MTPSPMRSTEPHSSRRTKIIAAALAAILLTGVALMAIVQGGANRGWFVTHGWFNDINARQQQSEQARRQQIVNDLKALGQEMHNNQGR
jgi:hypothetical protein